MTADSLENFVEEMCGDSHLRIEDDLGGGFVRLRSAEAERRQAVHDIRSSEDIVIEMLRNARDAHARNIFLALTRDNRERRFVMIDDGDGVPASMHEKIFEPRVTSKLDSMHIDKWGVHGRGMALYSIYANSLHALICSSGPQKGSSFLVQTDLDKIGEKTDQSTFPTFELLESGSVHVRGPKNIVRCACEFAIDSRDNVSVYLGSATDIAATLYLFGLATLSRSQRVFCRDLDDVPVCKRLSTCSDPASFAACCEELGLSMSERSARRILDGSIAPLEPLLDQVKFVRNEDKLRATRKVSSKIATGDDRGMKIDSDDLSDFSDLISRHFQELARRYYLDEHVEPEVKVSKDGLRIFIPFIKDN